MDFLNDNWNLLTNLTHKIVSNAEKKSNITHIEAFFTGAQTIQVSIRDSDIQGQNKILDFGVGFRIATEKNKVGFSCTNTLSEKTVSEAFNTAYKISKVSPETPSFTLPTPKPLPKISGLYDPQIPKISEEDIIDIAKQAIQAAEDHDERVIVKSGRISFESGWKGVWNNFGVDVEEKYTRSWMFLGGSAQHQGEVTGGCYDTMYRRDAKLEPQHVGKTVGHRVIQMLNKKNIESFLGTVVFSPEAVSYQIVDVLIDTLNGGNAVSKSSAWSEQLDQVVSTTELSLLDDPLTNTGYSSRTFDDEGCASQQTPLIKKGILKNYLHFATSATKHKKQNTGNASRYGGFDMVRNIIGEGYRTKPIIYPSNLRIPEGTKSEEELVSEIDRGILVGEMAGFPQKSSGIVSLQLSRAFYVEKGEIKFPIKGGMISGVTFDWLTSLSGIGNNQKHFQNAIVPSLRVENVKIVSK